MKCPLAVLGYVMKVGSAPTHQADCLEKECAWWDEGSGACAIWALMSGLDALGRVLREIECQMPQEK